MQNDLTQTNTRLYDAIWQKYIQPLDKKRPIRIGIEFEFPIVCFDGAVDFALVHALTDAFLAHFDFTAQSRDEEGAVYLALHAPTGDSLSFDCSYNTLELSFGTADQISEVEQRFRAYYLFIQQFLTPHGHTLTGLGVNPGYHRNRIEPIHSERYRMLYHHLSSYPLYTGQQLLHHIPHFAMLSTASQVQLDVHRENFAQVLRVFSMLEPYKALLFANSRFDERPDYLLNRDYFWAQSLHGLNPHNVDGYRVFPENAEEMVDYIASMSLYCTQRNGKYIHFAPTPLRRYVSMEEMTGQIWDSDAGAYRETVFTPSIEDIADLRSYKAEDLTYRGTVEFRSVCTQPVQESFTTAAFHLGILENLDAAEEFLQRDFVLYHKGYDANELRALCCRRALPAFALPSALRRQLTALVQLAAEGLHRRGRAEEGYLLPLYSRAERLSSPARDYEKLMGAGLNEKARIQHFAQL